ncbi:MAG TPA: sulfotransferase, partial [Acidimicrobiales bacterium]|nr:sulfotransferase [Acidimicrobiales bacterium]
FMCDGPPVPQHGPGDAHSAREWIWERGRYEGLFAKAPTGALKGESTPFYLWDRQSHKRIRALIPDAKLIAVLRDPVDRAYSNWTHMWCDGLEPEADFVRACQAEPARVAAGWAPFWRYLELGRYGEQLADLYETFPPEQVHVLRYRALIDGLDHSLDRICEFLGVATGAVSRAPSENVSTWVEPTALNRALQGLMRAGASSSRWLPPAAWRRVSAPLLAALHRHPGDRPELPLEQRRELAAHYRDDVRLLERLTGDSYSEWLFSPGEGTYSVRKSCGPSGRAIS